MRELDFLDTGAMTRGRAMARRRRPRGLDAGPVHRTERERRATKRGTSSTSRTSASPRPP